MTHILVICTANICRSPLAEAILRQRLHDEGKDDWQVSSAGTWAQLERGAARYSIQLAKKQGLDISNHRARMVTREIVDGVDLVLCMTQGHKESLQIEFPTQAHKIFLFSEMVERNYDISDPYGGPYAGYVEMAREVNYLIKSGLPRVMELATQTTIQE